MNGEARRQEIIKILAGAQKPVSGTALAEQLGVSRQVIVQDIALLKASEINIVSTAKGYLLGDSTPDNVRVFKVSHSDEQTQDELNTIVDLGGKVIDVFVKHKVYGEIKAPLNIESRLDVEEFMENLRSGKSSLLKNVTSAYHYHTVEAKDAARLDAIEKALEKRVTLLSCLIMRLKKSNKLLILT